MPLVTLALREGLGEMGDVTSQAIVPAGSGSATLWSKDSGVEVEFVLHNGTTFAKGVALGCRYVEG